MKCVLCKSEIPNGSLFCNVCGCKQVQEEEGDHATIASECGNIQRRRRQPQGSGEVDSTCDDKDLGVGEREKKQNTGCVVYIVCATILAILLTCFLIYMGAHFILIAFEMFAVYFLAFALYAWLTDDTHPDVTKERNQRAKYSDYRYTCPQCGSNHVRKIGNLNRGVSVAAWGLASSKIGKQYECDNCKHKW